MSPDFLIKIAVALTSLLGVVFALLTQLYAKRAAERSNQRVAHAESKAESEPEKIKPAWDLARVTLESYFNRNLSQVTAIFWLCVFVMLVGFGIIIWGTALAIQSPESNVAPLITGLAGVVTELIGATFLFVYRSTMQQAINYTKTLERINSVGMAMQILDTISDGAKSDDLKSSTKATVVKMLMQQSFHLTESETAKLVGEGKAS